MINTTPYSWQSLAFPWTPPKVRFVAEQMQASNGLCPDCGLVILDCWRLIVLSEPDGWIAVEATCSGATTWCDELSAYR